MLQESGGGFFFKSKTTLHRAAHVHEQAEFDGQVGFAAEIEDRLHGLVVVENVEKSVWFKLRTNLPWRSVAMKSTLTSSTRFLMVRMGSSASSLVAANENSAIGVYRHIGSGNDVGGGLGASGNETAQNRAIANTMSANRLGNLPEFVVASSFKYYA